MNIFTSRDSAFILTLSNNPLSNFFKQNYANQLVRYGDRAEGEKKLREVVADWPDHSTSIAVLAFSPLLSISTNERMDFAERWASSIGYSEPARARIMVEAMTDESRRPEASTVLLEIYDECGWFERYPEIAAAFNDRELTLSLLQQGTAMDKVSAIGAGTDPLFAFIAAALTSSSGSRRSLSSSVSYLALCGQYEQSSGQAPVLMLSNELICTALGSKY